MRDTMRATTVIARKITIATIKKTIVAKTVHRSESPDRQCGKGKTYIPTSVSTADSPALKLRD